MKVHAADAALLDQPLPAEVVHVSARRHPVEDVRPREQRPQRLDHFRLAPIVCRIILDVAANHLLAVFDEDVRVDAAPIELVPKPVGDAGIVRGVEDDDRALSAWARHGDEARDERRAIDRRRIDDGG